MITDALPRGPVGAYQLQAAIAAVHDEAPDAATTDWPQIVALYELLLQCSDSPIVALNHAVAVAMRDGASEGLQLLETLRRDARITSDRRFHAVRAHLLELAGQPADRARRVPRSCPPRSEHSATPVPPRPSPTPARVAPEQTVAILDCP